MARPTEINLKFGQDGLRIETEQCPDSPNPKALTNAPDGAFKHGVDMEYRGGKNPRRRKGTEDLWHRPENKTVEITLNGAPPMTNEPTVGDILEDDITGAQMRVLSADIGTLTVRGISLDALLFVNGNTVSTFTSPMVAPTLAPANPRMSAVDYTIDTYDVQCQFAIAPSGEFCDSIQTWGDTATLTHGIRGLARFIYLDNKQDKSGAGFDLERYTIFATKDEAFDTFPETSTYHFRNRGTPNLKRLGLPLLDHEVFNPGVADYFSDVNINGFEAARFWNYLQWSRGGEQETYLIGTCAGHYHVPAGVPAAPSAWLCGAGSAPPAVPASFNNPYINAACIQRRMMYWFPTWYEWWSDLMTYTIVPEVGLHYWTHPFIWYWKMGQNGASDFYAEPAGRFVERYGDSLFIARIERQYLEVHGEGENDTVGWTYEPSAIMWSFWGYATGMELGTPPVYPFAIPYEPRERVWGCAAQGFQLNRHTSFNAGDGLAVVGLKVWNGSLYVMKPNGFMQVYGSFSGDFQFRDLDMSQGPCGPFAWAKADMGIFYVTKKGLYLFDGNKSSENVCLSTCERGGADVSKIFREDIDWNNSTNFLTGEVLTISMVWDKVNSQLIISYPKRGEQGGGGQNDLPRGTPTRQLIYDTNLGRFTEWNVPMLRGDNTTHHPGIGMMLSGRDPTDDDKVLLSHPIGNYLGSNDNGRLLELGSTGHRDNVEIDGDAQPEPLSGDRITYDATSKDHTAGALKSKLTMPIQRQLIYANNGGIKRKVIYNYYNENDEEELTFGATADGYYSEKRLINTTVTAGTDSSLSLFSMKYYHDDSVHTALRIEFDGVAPMTTAPAVGSTLTQGVSGATLLVTSTDLANLYVYGQDLGTGTWDTANIVNGGGMLPADIIPSALLTVVNPDNTNIDGDIQFVAVSVEIAPTSGDSQVSE